MNEQFFHHSFCSPCSREKEVSQPENSCAFCSFCMVIKELPQRGEAKGSETFLSFCLPYLEKQSMFPPFCHVSFWCFFLFRASEATGGGYELKVSRLGFPRLFLVCPGTQRCDEPDPNSNPALKPSPRPQTGPKCVRTGKKVPAWLE